jgi:hypothetical protein
VPTDETLLLHRLIGGDPAADNQVLAQAASTSSASLLVAAALLSRDVSLLERASGLAGTPRERQLVALAAAQLRADTELFDVLVRDHLAAYPDHLLAAWIAGRRTNN